MTSARYVRPHAVENFLALLVRIETVRDKRPQESAALRNPCADGPLHFTALFAIRDVIAHCRHAESRHRGIFRRVHEII
jgi:hypothetical protein